MTIASAAASPPAERSGYLSGRLGVAFIVRATFAVATVRAPCAL